MNQENEMQNIFQDRRKLPSNIKNKIYMFIFFNFIINILMSIIILIINMAFYKFDLKSFQNYVKIIQIIMSVITIIIFEASYRKDSGKFAIHGIELLIFSILIIFVPYMYISIGNTMFLKIVIIAFTVYYIIKSIITAIVIRHDYIKENVSDVKDIIKEIDAPNYSRNQREKYNEDKNSNSEKKKQEVETKIEENYNMIENRENNLEENHYTNNTNQNKKKKKKTIKFSGGK